jgi:3-hydroxypropanoate dehydrogenase
MSTIMVADRNDTRRVSDYALDTIFREARTYNGWQDKPVSESLLREAYNLAKMAPTSANLSPARFVFLISPEAKERLLPALSPGNVEKTKSAPATVLIARDTEFYEAAPRLFPQMNIRPMFAANPALAEETAFRNSSLMGAYFILAARSLGLDCGPMSGFDAAKVDAEFFPDGKWKINFLCNVGYGDPASVFPRNPRLEFEDACLIL